MTELRVFVPYNVPSHVRDHPTLGRHRHLLVPGLFADAVRQAERGEIEVLACLRHDLRRIIGTTRDRSLRLEDTPAGLVGVVTIPELSPRRHHLETIERGHWRSASVGYERYAETWSTGADGVAIMRVTAIYDGGLTELTVCPEGAFPTARTEITPVSHVAARSAAQSSEGCRHTTRLAAARARLEDLRSY